MILIAAMITLVNLVHSHPRGHLLPLGEHMPPVGGAMMMGKFPSPWVFHKEFVKPSIPVIMRRVLENGDIPAYKKWTDDYLSDIFGHLKVEVENGKKENRVDGSVKKMTMKQYIDSYNELDGYLVTDIPKEMKGDISVPMTLQCGGFQSRIMNIIMWFSSGGTKSHLHNDGLDNINCLMDGRKDFFMVDKKHKDLVEADGWKVDGSLSYVDVERVDMYKFPKLQKLPWYKVTMNKGDCLFIPQGWYHHVDSAKGRNLALNFWFVHLLWHNMTECEGMDAYTAPPVPLNKFKVVKANEDLEMFRLELFESFESAGKEYISREDFLASAKKDDEETEKVFNKCFDEIDKDKDKVLSWEEIQTFDLVKIFNEHRDVLFPHLKEETDTESDYREEEDEVEEDEDSAADGDENAEVDEENDEEFGRDESLQEDGAQEAEEVKAEEVHEKVILKDYKDTTEKTKKKSMAHEEL